MHIDIGRQTRLYYAYVALSNLSMISVVMNLYLAHMGFSLYQIGVLLAILQMGNTVLEIPTGFVADRFGNRASLLAALVLRMAGYALMPLAGASAGSLAAMAAVMVVLALANTLTTGCASAIVTNALIAAGRADRLTDLNARSGLVFYCCYGAAALASGWLSERGYGLVVALSVACLAGALVAVALMRDVAADDARGARPIRVREAARYVLTNRPALYYALVEGAVAWSMVPVDDFYNNYLHDSLGIPLGLVGVVVAVQFVAASLAGLLSSRLARRVPEVVLARLGPVVVVALFLLFALSPDPRAAVALYLLGLAAFRLVNPVRTKLLDLAVDARFRVTVGSFNSIAISLLSAVSQPVFGWLAGELDMRAAMAVLIAITLALLAAINLAFPDEAITRTTEGNGRAAR